MTINYGETEFESTHSNMSGGGSTRDSRFIGYDVTNADKKPGIMVEGQNLITILPPFSNHEARFQQMLSDGQPLRVGNFYTKLAVKTFTDQRPAQYRAEPGNHIVEAFGKLYSAMKTDEGKFTPALKTIADHMGGFGDSRAVVNCYMQTDKSMIRWFDVPVDSKKGESKRLYARLIALIKELLPQHPSPGTPYFDLRQALVLNFDLSFSDKIPAIQHLKPQPFRQSDGKAVVVDTLAMMEKNIENFDVSMLDDAETWTKAFDELPALTDIPNLMLNGVACDILGLSSNTAQATTTQVQGGGAPAQAEATPAAGFDPSSFEEAPVAQPQSQPATQQGVSSDFSSMGDPGAEADNFAAQLEAAQTAQAAQAGQAPAAGDDEPPF